MATPLILGSTTWRRATPGLLFFVGCPKIGQDAAPISGVGLGCVSRPIACGGWSCLIDLEPRSSGALFR
jgi:hypothetical protein